MKNSDRDKLRRAHKKVENLKAFYKHLLIYCIVNIALFLARGSHIQIFESESLHPNFINWIDWNILSVPAIWGIWLTFHAAKVYSYKPKFIANWEKRQMEKFFNEV